MTRHHRALVATVAVAGSVLSACGSSPAPVSTPTPTVVTTSASPKPTATAKPLSPFEGRAPVKVLRRWAVLLEKAINSGDRTMSAVRPVLTPAGLAQLRTMYVDDLAHHYRWPGPQPFTPTKVTGSGSTYKVDVCVETSGWSIDRKTGKRVRRPGLTAGSINLVTSGKTLKIDSFAGATFSCKHVKVREVR